MNWIELLVRFSYLKLSIPRSCIEYVRYSSDIVQEKSYPFYSKSTFKVSSLDAFIASLKHVHTCEIASEIVLNCWTTQQAWTSIYCWINRHNSVRMSRGAQREREREVLPWNASTSVLAVQVCEKFLRLVGWIPWVAGVHRMCDIFGSPASCRQFVNEKPRNALQLCTYELLHTNTHSYCTYVELANNEWNCNFRCWNVRLRSTTTRSQHWNDKKKNTILDVSAS